MKKYLNSPLKKLLAAAGVLALSAPAMAEVTFYQNDRFEGRSVSVQTRVDDLHRYGFNDRASSVDVRGGRWEVCEDSNFRGRCVVLRSGSYPSLRDMGLNDRVTSARLLRSNDRIDEARYAPPPQPAYNYYRRGGERLYEAQVTQVKAVMGEPNQRCWVERDRVVRQDQPNVPGALAGAVIGGILGHQIGGGNAGTAVGVFAGGALGANIDRGQQQSVQNVQRCQNVPDRTPDYYDVVYRYNGVYHHVQTTNPPGPTVTVNGRGEPRSS
ncbi:MAG TPA: beta/gamma crystallin-related protein [Ideonella sp.]|uniref:beta/gamma crystallin-related protein n=1 Tax=Ideonella sp. TaxID=1929293 RepID=UPI002CD96EF6|nr:beta/gamma crystallin-related protein [Ideonella sp.]HSI49877.1 beta/gamma crystallin-related protein [Ideonella sp.]